MMRPTLIDYLTRQLYHVVLGKWQWTYSLRAGWHAEKTENQMKINERALLSSHKDQRLQDHGYEDLTPLSTTTEACKCS
jgi:hypothetical protein